MQVYVLNKHGEPLMPCSPRKARKLLKDQKARVVRRTPFTIRLLYGSTEHKQPITLGVDTGARHVGFSASTETQELFACEMQPRNDIVKLLSDRNQLRRSRRYRKTRYRKARLNNRVHSKHKGWLAPSVEVKIQEHITMIKRICRILPVSKVIVETAEFDLQRMKAMLAGNPLPVGTDYQMGEMYDIYNVRQYVLKRDGYKCRCCGKKTTAKQTVKLHVHHIESRKTGGNAPNNYITLCEHCHKGVHSKMITLNGVSRGRSFRDAAFMGIMRKTLMHRLRDELTIPVFETYGYITKLIRETHGMEKDHITDALCIAEHPEAVRCEVRYLVKPVRHHNRQLHKANPIKGGTMHCSRRKTNQAPYLVKGFRLWDKVSYQGKIAFISGRRATGYFALRTLSGDKVSNSIHYKNLRLLEPASNYLIERWENAIAGIVHADLAA